jgi:hypothetical protein
VRAMNDTSHGFAGREPWAVQRLDRCGCSLAESAGRREGPRRSGGPAPFGLGSFWIQIERTSNKPVEQTAALLCRFQSRGRHNGVGAGGCRSLLALGDTPLKGAHERTKV